MVRGIVAPFRPLARSECHSHPDTWKAAPLKEKDFPGPLMSTQCSLLKLPGQNRRYGVFSEEPVGVFFCSPCRRRGSTLGDVPGGHFVIGPV